MMLSTSQASWQENLLRNTISQGLQREVARSRSPQFSDSHGFPWHIEIDGFNDGLPFLNMVIFHGELLVITKLACYVLYIRIVIYLYHMYIYIYNIMNMKRNIHMPLPHFY